MLTDVSLLGTGLLGSSVVRRLLATGLSVTCWNRTGAKADALRGAGAEVASAADDALGASPVALLYLADAAAIRELLFALSPARLLAGRTLVQMGTIAPAESVALGREVETLGGSWLEAPVLGSGPQALSGELIVLCGGEEALFARCRPLLERLGPDPVLVGETGKAAALKLALNNLIGSLTASFGVSLALVRASGIDPALFMKVLRPSALYAPTFDKKLPMIQPAASGLPPRRHDRGRFQRLLANRYRDAGR